MRLLLLLLFYAPLVYADDCPGILCHQSDRPTVRPSDCQTVRPEEIREHQESLELQLRQDENRQNRILYELRQQRPPQTSIGGIPLPQPSR